MADATVIATPPISAADALRQAALQSRLRNKRKRSDPSEPTTPNTLPPPTPDSVVILNYDDEPTPAEPIVPAAAVVMPAESGSDSAKSAVADDEDSLEREDGEISEADVDSSSLPAQPTSTEPPPTAAEIERSLLLTPNHPPRPYRSAAQPAHENGLRPKLRISPGELHEFKLHLLDILGFGVPPEYLIEYGVSPETLAYALHELNFRQPTNLVFPDNDANVHFYPSGLNQQIELPPPPSTNGKASPSMLEIESQKKRELQARKAALAAKRAASVSTPATPTTTGLISASPTALEPVVDVDDFLRSIAAPIAAPPPAPLLRTQSPDAMQVDIAPSIVPPHPEQRPRSTSAGLSINSDPVSTLPRGIKRARPVAADFDDNETPSRPPSAMRPPPMRNPMRKLSSFSNLNMQLREPLVIHVSDSEDDGHDEHWATAPPSRPMSALEEREAQIAAMKERIAAAELKKKARVSTPVPIEPKREVQTPTIRSPERHPLGSVTSAPPADCNDIADVTMALVSNDPAHVQDLSVHNSMEVDDDPADKAARIEHSSPARGGLADDSVTNNPPDVSAQNAEGQGHVHDALDEYRSFFSAYPGMRYLVQDSDGVNSVFLQEDARLTFDANGKICQYEVPGGGECKDATCTDVHLSRL